MKSQLFMRFPSPIVPLHECVCQLKPFSVNRHTEMANEYRSWQTRNEMKQENSQFVNVHNHVFDENEIDCLSCFWLCTNAYDPKCD